MKLVDKFGHPMAEKLSTNAQLCVKGRFLTQLLAYIRLKLRLNEHTKAVDGLLGTASKIFKTIVEGGDEAPVIDAYEGNIQAQEP